MKLEAVDIVGKKLIDGKNIDKEKNWKLQNEKFFYETFSGNFNNLLNENFSKTVNNLNNKINFSKTNNF